MIKILSDKMLHLNFCTFQQVCRKFSQVLHHDITSHLCFFYSFQNIISQDLQMVHIYRSRENTPFLLGDHSIGLAFSKYKVPFAFTQGKLIMVSLSLPYLSFKEITSIALARTQCSFLKYRVPFASTKGKLIMGLNQN